MLTSNSFHPENQHNGGYEYQDLELEVSTATWAVEDSHADLGTASHDLDANANWDAVESSFLRWFWLFLLECLESVIWKYEMRKLTF